MLGQVVGSYALGTDWARSHVDPLLRQYVFAPAGGVFRAATLVDLITMGLTPG
jgi:hypothetical protein